MKIKSLAILAVAAVGFTACSDAWLEDYKLDQNRPSDVSMGTSSFCSSRLWHDAG